MIGAGVIAIWFLAFTPASSVLNRSPTSNKEYFKTTSLSKQMQRVRILLKGALTSPDHQWPIL
jgi:hypothetical protein